MLLMEHNRFLDVRKAFEEGLAKKNYNSQRQEEERSQQFRAELEAIYVGSLKAPEKQAIEEVLQELTGPVTTLELAEKSGVAYHRLMRYLESRKGALTEFEIIYSEVRIDGNGEL